MKRFLKISIHLLIRNDIVCYLFFGGLTVLVNLGFFYLFSNVLKWNLNLGNFLSIIAAILFAYYTNSRIVFRTRQVYFKKRLREFWLFICTRSVTLALELFGVHYLVNILIADAMLSKMAIQFAVVVLNYVFSKLIIFRDKYP